MNIHIRVTYNGAVKTRKNNVKRYVRAVRRERALQSALSAADIDKTDAYTRLTGSQIGEAFRLLHTGENHEQA